MSLTTGDQSEWVPVSVLPNVSVRDAVEDQYAALVPPDDLRVAALSAAHPALAEFLGKFTDAFGVPVQPSIILLHRDAPKGFRAANAVASFRDAIAISTLARSRSLDLVYGHRGGPRLRWSNSFALYPWMLDKNYEHLVVHTPDFLGLHEVREFRGQSSPELSTGTLMEDDVDQPLLKAILKRWRRRYRSDRPGWQDQALFRSLNMANQAAQLPAGSDTTFYDVGRLIALWVSAFEILAHPGVGGKSDILKVYEFLERVEWRDAKVGRKRFKCHARGQKNPPYRSLACWIYSGVYKTRCAFLHGNPVTPEGLTMHHSERSQLAFTAPLYRLALTVFLPLNWGRQPPSHSNKALGKWIADKMEFDGFQEAAERALLRARKTPK